MRPYLGKIITICGFFAGLGLTAWLISRVGIGLLLGGFNAVGWGVVLVISVRATVVATNGVAWSRLLAQMSRVPLWGFICARWFRESADCLLPLAGISGGVIGARALTFWRVRGALAAASVVADLLLQTLAQALFALFGVIMLWPQVEWAGAWPGIAAAAAIASIFLAGFYALQRHGGAHVIDRAFVVISARIASNRQYVASGFHNATEKIWHGRRGYVLADLTLHLVAWSIGTLEVWITLHLLGFSISVQQALVLESLGTSISSAAFFIPGSWGVQEGGYILIGQFLGLPVEASLLLSLVKRIPDLALGVSGLAAWYAVEARRLWLRSSGKAVKVAR